MIKKQRTAGKGEVYAGSFRISGSRVEPQEKVTVRSSIWLLQKNGEEPKLPVKYLLSKLFCDKIF